MPPNDFPQKVNARSGDKGEAGSSDEKSSGSSSEGSESESEEDNVTSVRCVVLLRLVFLMLVNCLEFGLSYESDSKRVLQTPDSL